MYDAYEPDFTKTYNFATSSSDNSVTVANDLPSKEVFATDQPTGSLYYVSVTGAQVWIAYNTTAVASTTFASMPIGMTPKPWRIPPGTVVHAITSSGTGQLSLIRAKRAG